ncbi:MAG: MaoC family dehydratase [Candidatus Viridilinea halotolerans]|uniref:Beta-methylmalyl-CoA dehydratase n=1 Tax=Candidatus Viridilinea halotolerans TaxID=2491704 RepID=A0A426U3U6_9CHLR|nr:MAG: MaoC family dehydratase [Candidatus Viridilinea halotolerans]
MGNPKTQPGNYFEDFRLGQTIIHATPRTVTAGDVALYTALYGGRFALSSSDLFAQQMGLPQAPIESMLAFHIVFGKTVPDISLNAIANLGYASGRFGQPVYPGDTLSSTSEVLGLRQNRDGKTGVVYVRTVGVNQRDEMVVEYVRWVMVRKRDTALPAPEAVVPTLPAAVAAADLLVAPSIKPGSYNTAHAGSPHRWGDYEPGERIDHLDGITIEEADHMLATRLYQNTARVHFNQHVEREGRFGRRIVYGGHIISLARSLSFNGLANAQCILAINGGRHTNPSFAGDTIYAWSEVLERVELPGRNDVGAMRIRTVATKDRPCHDFPAQDDAGNYDPAVVLDFDYTVLLPR